MPKEEKSTSFEKDKRIDVVCELLVSGASRSQMIQYVAKKTEWNLSSRQIDQYISYAKEKIKNSDIDKGFEIQRAKLRLEKLYKKNESNEDFKECRALIESMAKLFGWNEAEKVDANINISWNEEKTYEK